MGQIPPSPQLKFNYLKKLKQLKICIIHIRNKDIITDYFIEVWKICTNKQQDFIRKSDGN